MIALLRKDRPWLLGCLVAGLVALCIGLVQDGVLLVMVLGSGPVQGAFHVSWIAGLLLGICAGSFDEWLGTRELLTQRAVSATQVAVARGIGCLSVLVAWAFVTPLLAWTWERWFGGMPAWDGCAEVWLTTNTVAWSACAIGWCAASMPFHPLLRLVLAFAWFWTGFLVVHLASRGSTTSAGVFAFGHLGLAALFAGVAVLAARVRRDGDRPLPRATRVGVLPLVVVGVWGIASCALVELEARSVRYVQASYPSLKLEGGKIVLVRWSKGDWEPVDAEHRPVPRELGPVRDLGSGNGGRWFSTDTEFEEPWWGRTREYRTMWMRGTERATGSLMVGRDGRLWFLGNGSLQPLAKPSGATSAGGLVELGTDHAPIAAWLEPGAYEVWPFEPEERQFVSVPTPDGGALLSSARAYRVDHAVWTAEVQLDRRGDLAFLRGTKANYAFDGEVLKVLPDHPVFAPRHASEPPRERRGDPLEYTIRIPATEFRDAFEHTFVPRTAEERGHAAMAMLWSLLRAPLPQVVGHFLVETPWPGWLFDALVADGRRGWLVLLHGMLWACCALLVRWRLRRLGAAPAVANGWAVATLCIGPVGMFASVVFERPRAFANRAIAAPTPPRIITAATATA